MNRCLKFLSLVFVFCCSSLPCKAEATRVVTIPANKRPLAFTKNVGQWNDQVLFRAEASGATIWLTKEGLTYQFTREVESNESGDGPTLTSTRGVTSRPDRFSQKRDSFEQLVINAKFVGADSNSAVTAEGLMEYECNYFLGSDPKKWFTRVPNYQTVTFRNLYDGIDVIYTMSDPGTLEERVVARQGSEIADVAIKYEGVDRISTETTSEIAISTSWGTIYRRTGLKRGCEGNANTTNASALKVRDDGSICISLGEQTIALGSTKTEVVSTFGLYLGGNDFDRASGVAVDANRCTFVCGRTSSSDFPTIRPLQTSGDMFVTKLDSSGHNLEYSTYVGGSGSDNPSDLAVDSEGNVFVVGGSSSWDFPATDPLYAYNSGQDVVIFELSNGGDSLKFSAFFGGSSDDYANGLAILDDGTIAIAGNTESTNFPLVQPVYPTNKGHSDVFVLRFDPLSRTVLFSTFIGGYDWDYGYGIAGAVSTGIWVTGTTHSPNFPTVRGSQNSQGNGDAFLLLFDLTGTSIKYSSYFGGSEWDEGTDIAIDSNGSACFVGYTASANLPVLHAIQSDQPGWDVVTARIDTSGHMIYSTYVGGTGDDYGTSITVSCTDETYITGFTDSPNLPVVNPIQSYSGGGEAFLFGLSPSGTRIRTGTYLGGSNGDGGYSVAVDCSGYVTVAGSTSSPDFSLVREYSTFSAWEDAFVVRIRTYQCGDEDDNSLVNVSDVVRILFYVFMGSNDPADSWAGDADCSSTVNISDAVYLINYIFSGGAAPCAACP